MKKRLGFFIGLGMILLYKYYFSKMNFNFKKSTTGLFSNDNKMVTGGWKIIDLNDELTVLTKSIFDRLVKNNTEFKYDRLVQVETQVVAGVNIRFIVEKDKKLYAYTFHKPLDQTKSIEFLHMRDHAIQ